MYYFEHGFANVSLGHKNEPVCYSSYHSTLSSPAQCYQLLVVPEYYFCTFILSLLLLSHEIVTQSTLIFFQGP